MNANVQLPYALIYKNNGFHNNKFTNYKMKFKKIQEYKLPKITTMASRARLREVYNINI